MGRLGTGSPRTLTQRDAPRDGFRGRPATPSMLAALAGVAAGRLTSGVDRGAQREGSCLDVDRLPRFPVIDGLDVLVSGKDRGIPRDRCKVFVRTCSIRNGASQGADLPITRSSLPPQRVPPDVDRTLRRTRVAPTAPQAPAQSRRTRMSLRPGMDRSILGRDECGAAQVVPGPDSPICSGSS